MKLNSSDINLKILDLNKGMYGSGQEASTSSYTNPYTEPIPASPPPARAAQLVYPAFPDVTLKKLPFYRLEETLLKPSSLQPNGKPFYLY